MIGRRLGSRLSMVTALVFVLSCAGSVVLAQEKSGSEVLKPLDEKAAAAEQAADKAVEKAVDEADKAAVKAEEKADEAVKAVEKKAEKPLVGVGAGAPGSHEGFIPTLSTQYGSITVLGVFQALLDTRYQLTVNQDTTNKDDRFDKLTATFQRARIIFKGHVVSKDFTYFFQGDAGNEKSFALDMTLGYNFGKTGLSIRVGRFVPDFSYMMPRNTADLAAINYPLYITTAGGLAIWRQLGFDIAYQPIPELIIKVGVFNGMLNSPYSVTAGSAYMQMGSIPIGSYGTGANKKDITVSNLTDNNRAKDVMMRVTYKPMKTLSVDLNMWVGFPAQYETDITSLNVGKLKRKANGELTANDVVVMGGPGVEYNDGTLHVVGEFMFRYLDEGESSNSKTALAAWGHVGYRFTKLIEGIVRVDWVDMDLDAENLMLMRVTAGPHFWLEEKHFRILVNLFCDIPLEKAETRQTNLGLQAQFAALW
jgi:hypothetical protein